MENQVPKRVVQDRYERLVALQDRIALEENEAQVGRTLEVLVANSEGRKDDQRHRLSGRAEDHRLVHFAVPPHAESPRPGDVVTVEVTSAAPYHLIADAEERYSVRRTRAGDAWDRRQAESCGAPSGSTPGAVGLGMPTIRPR